MVEMSKDQHDKCEVMMHLEMVLGLLAELPMKSSPQDGVEYLVEYRTRLETERRVWAALYLVQSMLGGSKPDNFDKVLEDARWFDAHAEMKYAINQAKGAN